MNARMRVAVPGELRDRQASSGTGKMWHQVLGRLAAEVSLLYVERPKTPRGLLMRPPDVWLSDGHQGPLAVDEPQVVQLHEASWHLPETRQHLEPWFLEAFEEPSRRAAGAAARVITPSESSRRQVIEAYGVDPRTVVAVPHGVDCEIFHPGLRGGAEIVAAAGGDGEAPYVLCVAQLHPRKNLPALRAAISALTRRGFPHQLAIVGAPAADRPERRGADGEALAGNLELGRVVLLRDLGERDLARVMAGCAAFCLPSLMEGFGLPVLEAMACGVPVVVSDRGSLPEVVGHAGIIVPPEAENLEAALAGVLDSPAHSHELGAAAAARAAEFGWERTARGWLHVLEDAADGSL